MLRIATPLLTYDYWRQAYRLRLVGDRYGPVLRPDRRHHSVGYAGPERRTSTRRRSGVPGGMNRVAYICVIALLAAFIGVAVALLPPENAGRAASSAGTLAPHATRHQPVPSVIASGTMARMTPVAPPRAHRSRMTTALAHRAHPRTPHHRTAPVLRRRARSRSHAPAYTAPAAGTSTHTTTSVATTRTSVATTSTPVQTTSTPVISTPSPVGTTPAPVETTPSPPQTAPTGTTRSTSTGSPSTSSSPGTGTVNGGG